jgi:urea transporter
MAWASAQIVNSAMAPIVVRDSDGRELVLRRMTALDRLRLFKAIGPVLSQNNLYLGMAMLAASVIAIDTVPVPPPVTEGQIEGLVARLGDCGISAVAAGLAADAPAVMGSAAQGN